VFLFTTGDSETLDLFQEGILSLRTLLYFIPTLATGRDVTNVSSTYEHAKIWRRNFGRNCSVGALHENSYYTNLALNYLQEVIFSAINVYALITDWKLIHLRLYWGVIIR